MGGGSKTYTFLDVTPLMASDSVTGEDIPIKNKLRKEVFLQSAKFINDGMDTVVMARGQSIATMKGLYNRKQLENLGYTYTGEVNYKAISNALLLQYSKNNISSSITAVGNARYGYLSDEVSMQLYVQSNYGYSVSDNTITYTDGKEYTYMYTQGNGALLEGYFILNYEDTVIPYLDTEYPDGYTIISTDQEIALIDSSYVYQVEIEITYEDELGDTVVETIALDVPTTGIYITIPSPFSSYIDEIVTLGSGTEVVSIYETGSDDIGSYTYEVARYAVTVSTIYVDGLEFASTVTNITHLLLIDTPEYRSMASDIALAKFKNLVLVRVSEIVQTELEHIIYTYVDNDKTYLGALLLTDHTDLITIKEAQVLPNIALKLNGEFTEDTNKQKAVLNKVGIAAGDFEESLADSKIQDAYLSFTFSVWEDTEVTNKVLFETFDSLVVGAYDVVKSSKIRNSSFGFNMGVEMKYAADVSDRIVLGSIGAVGTYEREETYYPPVVIEGPGGENGPDYTEPYRTITLRKQETDIYYTEIVISTLVLEYSVAGTIFRYSLEGVEPDRMLRMFVMKDVIGKLPFNDYCDILEYSISVLSYAVVVVKTKWYQTGFFSFVMMAAALVASVVTGNPAIFIAAVSFRILSRFLPTKVVAALAIVYTIVTFDPSNLGSTSAAAVLTTASSLVNIVSSISSMYFSMQTDKLQSQVAQAKEEEREAAEDYQALIESQGTAINSFSRGFKDVDRYYEIATGDLQYNYDILYDFDSIYNVDRVLSSNQ